MADSQPLAAPKSCHRFVGYLEEEAVHTYTGLVKALERNEVPEWAPETGFRVPQISIDYWRLPQEATSAFSTLSLSSSLGSNRT